MSESIGNVAVEVPLDVLSEEDALRKQLEEEMKAQFDMLEEVSKQILIVQERRGEGETDSPPRSLDITNNISGNNLLKSSMSKHQKGKKTVSFSEHDLYYTTEYQEPYINEGDIVDDHLHVNI